MFNTPTPTLIQRTAGAGGILLKVLFVVLLLFVLTPGNVQAQQGRPDLLEIIDVSGVINDGMARTIAAQVEAINEVPKIRAVLLTVDSPGGSVLPSASIYEDLSRLKVPVVAFCNNVCASGGLYILTAPSVKWIAVRTQTIGGSVGVVMQVTRFNRLLDWLKIDNETYVSGALKDAGSPLRAARDDERKYLQNLTMSLAERFYELVEKSRPRASSNMNEIKTARIFAGSDIVRVGLADAVSTKEEAIKKAKELSGSKSIFTRDELKKMSKAADEHPVPQWRLPLKVSEYGDVAWLIETLKEIREGESIRFEYRLPYRF